MDTREAECVKIEECENWSEVAMPFPLDQYGQETIERHFKRRQFRWDEDYFTSVLECPRSKHDVYWAAIGLRKVGTERSVPALRALFTFPMKDVKCVSILTIAHIVREKATLILSEALLDPKYPEKTYAMWAINDAADERAIPAVLEYFSRNKSKLRNGKLVNGTFVDGVQFLANHTDKHADARVFLESISGFWKKICAGERTELQKRLPELARNIEERSNLTKV
jgi:hypothetical protein